MFAARPGMIRLWRTPKNMSLHESTRPPFSAAATSISAPPLPRLRQSGTTSPWTRSRATPPSGKMLSRRWVIRCGEAIAKRFFESPRSCDLGSTSTHRVAGPSSSSGEASGRAAQASMEHWSG